MIIVGEKINATSKSVGEAIAARDREFIERLAVEQAKAGADFIDLNTAEQNGEGLEADAMTWLVGVVQAATDKPIAVDSDSPRLIKAALQKYSGEKVLINSVTAEPDRLEPIGALAAERRRSGA